MKNLIPLFVVLCISFASMARGNWSYKRLNRLYQSNQTKCLKVSKRHIKYFPDSPAAYYFASIVYRNKSKKHGELKTRYMMMSKSIGYAMKFENFDDLDLETKVNWEGYLDELRLDTDSLIKEMAVTELACYGERLALKHHKMVESRSDVILVTAGTDGPPVIPPVVAGNGNTDTDENSTTSSSEPAEPTENSSKKGYFGLASGKEVAPSYNQIQEQRLLELINEQRKELFMSPLKMEHSLTRAARYHAYDMATQNYLKHDSYDNIDGSIVYAASTEERVGQFHPKRHFLAQNIAGGPQSAQETLDDWMQYDDEYDVLFDESSKKVGIGIFYDPDSDFGYYWVLVTAKK